MIRMYQEPWHPFKLRGQLDAWWCADDIRGGQSTIQNWRSRVKNFTLSQGTAASRPQLVVNVTSVFAGRPCAFFDGTDDYLTAAIGFNAADLLTEMWFSADVRTFDVTRMFGGTGGASLATARTMRGLNSGTSVAGAGDGTTTNGVTFTTPTLDRPLVFAGFFGAGNITGRMSGVSTPAFAANSVTLNTGVARTVMGASTNASPVQFCFGYIRHMMIFSGHLAEADRVKLEGWLSWDSGRPDLLPSSATYRFVHPLM